MIQERRRAQRIKDYTGFENENWKVIKVANKCPKTGRLSWIIKCKHCGSSSERKASCLNKNKSCGCIKPIQPNKGKSVLDDIDKVNGYWLMRKSWAEGTRLQVGA